MIRFIFYPQGTHWFGEDGQLKRLSSPLKEKPTRPPIINLEELDPLLQTEWVKVRESFDPLLVNLDWIFVFCATDHF